MKSRTILLIHVTLLLPVENYSATSDICYINEHSEREICTIPNTGNNCCHGEVTHIQIQTYRSLCTHEQRCSRTCCNKTHEVEDEHFTKLFEDAFKTTNCFVDVSNEHWSEPYKHFLPQTDGFYHVEVTYTCQDKYKYTGYRVNVMLAVSIPVSVTVIIIVLAVTAAKVHRNSMQQRTNTVNNPNYMQSVDLILDTVVASSARGNNSSRSYYAIEREGDESEYSEIPADSDHATVNFGNTSTKQNPETHQAEIKNDLEHGRRTSDGSDGATGYDDHAYSQLEGLVATGEAEPEVPRPNTTKTSADFQDDQTSEDPLYFVLKKEDTQDRCDIGIGFHDTDRDENTSV